MCASLTSMGAGTGTGQWPPAGVCGFWCRRCLRLCGAHAGAALRDKSKGGVHTHARWALSARDGAASRHVAQPVSLCAHAGQGCGCAVRGDPGMALQNTQPGKVGMHRFG